MVTALLIALQALESGFWMLAWRRRQRDKLRARLVWGCSASTTLPVVDAQLHKSVGTPTRSQVRLADGIVKAARWITRTRAFELLVLKAIRSRWPQGKRL